MIRLFIVDDHPVVRSGVRALLAEEPNLQIVGEAQHGQDLLEQLSTTPADVVLLDVRMPVLDGLATTKRLHAEYPEVKVLVLSMLDQEEYVSRLFGAGALGYTLKNDDFPSIVLAVNTVATGRPYLCSELSLLMLRKVLAPKATLPETPAPNPYDFSTRELDVLHALADGLTTAEIATRLFTNRRIVETLRQQMLDKSKARNVAMLIRLVMAKGMLR